MLTMQHITEQMEEIHFALLQDGCIVIDTT